MAKRSAAGTPVSAAGKGAAAASRLPSPSSSTSTAASPPRDPLAYEHYIPRVPLQLVAIGFALLAPVVQGQDGWRTRPARFLEELGANPVNTLAVSSALVAVVQVWFGYWARSCRLQAQAQAKRHKDGQPEPSTAASTQDRPRRTVFETVKYVWSNPLGGFGAGSQFSRPSDPKIRIDTDFVPEALSVTLGSTVILQAASVLLGAPVVENAPLTFMLCLLLSLLAVTPLAIAIPPFQSDPNRFVWLRLASTLSPANDLELALFAPAAGAFIGCWSGAVPLPLDWDRPWQRYPTTLVLGALAGHAAGSLFSLAVVTYHAVIRTANDILVDAKQKKAGPAAKTTIAKGKFKSR
ncbi:hypothetical protein JCM8202_000710 [Rhodotorula sphaerocarpa]